VKASDYLAEWNVSEADDEMTFGRFVVTFVTFGLLLAAFLGIVLLVWASLP